MPEDNEKKIFIDDDWKAEAKREKERLAEESSQAEGLPAPTFSELINLIVMQAMAGLGLMTTPDGQRMPPNLEVAKHFIDLLQIVDEKTKGNLTDEEKKLLDQVLYETRMTYVQLSGGGGGMPGGAGPAPQGPGPQVPGQ